MKPRFSGSCCVVYFLITKFKENLELHFECLYYYACYQIIAKNDKTLMCMINRNECHPFSLDYINKASEYSMV